MSLYQIQDNDRPLWVQAEDYGQAVAKWKILIAFENDMEVDDVEDPQGVNFICDAEDFIE